MNIGKVIEKYRKQANEIEKYIDYYDDPTSVIAQEKQVYEFRMIAMWLKELAVSKDLIPNKEGYDITQCADCIHCEMCRWVGYIGCDFKDTGYPPNKE